MKFKLSIPGSDFFAWGNANLIRDVLIAYVHEEGRTADLARRRTKAEMLPPEFYTDMSLDECCTAVRERYGISIEVTEGI